MIYLMLFYEFFKTGLFAVGGGMATLPFLDAMALKTGWFTQAQLVDMIAVSESTPGPIGVNMATYVGFTSAGPLGSVIATLGLIAPSIIVILIIAKFLSKFKDSHIVKSIFYSLRPTSTALIAAAGVPVIMLSLTNSDKFKATGSILDLFNFGAILLAIILFILTNKIKATKKLHPVVFIAASAVIGIIFSMAG
ncbi:chromate transporter [Clostridium sp. NSJ-49]|uniref:Chromate transporter n=1 Tax=Clostridium disporicum TaxID=84024 RepID=A0A174B0M8_9CLOT|nr:MULTISPECIES: chromate transporter [Clostridium]MBC5626891.1 chromate transporter [Clostridium sp. NSJ-49]MCD2500669.1 chromate transporter [Clostridium sp. NSJ-145]CUN93769.1 chromate transporter [Clostridium disporicum]